MTMTKRATGGLLQSAHSSSGGVVRRGGKLVASNGAVVFRIRRTGAVVFEKAGADPKGGTMTTMQKKDAAWLADEVRKAVPTAKLTVHKPRDKENGGWVIDAELGKHCVVVEWTKVGGFAISTPADDEPYGSVAGEVRRDARVALERVAHLLKTGEQALTRREMRLQELREHRSISQGELAKAMAVSQPHISQTERRDDINLSTLVAYIRGLGGELKVIAKFDDELIELELGPEANDNARGVDKRARR